MRAMCLQIANHHSQLLSVVMAEDRHSTFLKVTFCHSP